MCIIKVLLSVVLHVTFDCGALMICVVNVTSMLEIVKSSKLRIILVNVTTFCDKKIFFVCVFQSIVVNFTINCGNIILEHAICTIF